ncbi:diguanylate cyclase domain-containing protein [Cohnella hongkongensis]|uniref:Diguanylate cyclase domain-containing protein n=1 Tax=Cohnella hongkongensis TaxID=178337 RepID=A0ABV9FAH8_9BACL
MSTVKSRFQLKLTLALILFAMLVSILLATSDHLRMREQAISGTERQIELYETSARLALDAVDKAYYLFGENIAAGMRKASADLISLYEANPNLDEWDLESLKQTYRLDIYWIDETNTITHSSYAPDIGLDFDECCGKLARILDERRSDGGFFHDGIDLEQNSGQLKKYSYQATKDKKHMIQLGYSLEDNEILREFDFFKTIDLLIDLNPSINDIQVLNIGGLPLGATATASAETLSGERRAAFDAAFSSGLTAEYRGSWKGESAVYRYVRYESRYDEGSTRIKMLEIVYNEKELERVLGVNTRAFLVQLAIILVVAAGLSSLIARWVARPMYLAFHDSLTDLKNRASFEEDIRKSLDNNNNNGTVGLLMIDLDNFKLVNDRLGHEAGDRLLRGVAGEMRGACGPGSSVYRLGGDEFVMLLPSTTRDEAEQAAERVLRSVRVAISSEADTYRSEITVSIGIAFAPEHGSDPYELCRHADAALYQSKEVGKNTYRVYRPAAAPPDAG